MLRLTAMSAWRENTPPDNEPLASGIPDPDPSTLLAALAPFVVPIPHHALVLVSNIRQRSGVVKDDESTNETMKQGTFSDDAVKLLLNLSVLVEERPGMTITFLDISGIARTISHYQDSIKHRISLMKHAPGTNLENDRWR